MGQFIDTQQALVTEAKQKRLEREQKQAEKKRQKQQELELFFTLDNMFANAKEEDRKNLFYNLSRNTNRDLIIDKIITIDNIDDVYVLTKKYNNILNNAYNAYKQEQKELEKEQKELEKQKEKEQKESEKNTYIPPAFTIEEYMKHTQPKIKIDKIKLLYIILLPILCIIWFLQGLTGTKRRK